MMVVFVETLIAKINEQGSQDDSKNYEIGEDDGILTVSLLLC